MLGWIGLVILASWGVIHCIRNERAYQEWAKERDQNPWERDHEEDSFEDH